MWEFQMAILLIGLILNPAANVADSHWKRQGSQIPREAAFLE